MKRQNVARITLFVIVGLWCVAARSHAQVTQDWVSYFDGAVNGSDLARALAISHGVASGFLYVTGSSQGTTGFDMATVCYLIPDGSHVWTATYDGPDHYGDEPVSIVIDNDSLNIYVVGKSDIFDRIEWVLVKYNWLGWQMWESHYSQPIPGLNAPVKLAITNDSRVVVTGFGPGSSEANVDIVTIKYNPDGGVEWISNYDGSGYSDSPSDLVTDTDGNIYVTGTTVAQDDNYNIVTIKYTPNGFTLWTTVYDTPENYDDHGTALALDDDGNVYVTGYTATPITAGFKTIKYNSFGEQQWAEFFTGPASNTDDRPVGIGVDVEGNVFVGGKSYSLATGFDYTIVKYNNLGNMLWGQIYNYSENSLDVPSAMTMDAFGNVYLTGASSLYDQDYATVKFTNNGDLEWVARFAGPGAGWADGATALGLDDDDRVFVTGTVSSPQGYDYATLGYSQINGMVPDHSGWQPDRIILLNNYPNPFNGSAAIRYTIPGTSLVNLKVYDTAGRCVATPVNGWREKGSHEVTFNGLGLSSGLYFAHLSAGNFTAHQKMVLLK